MALAFDVVEPASGNLLQHRDYLGVDVGKEGLPGAIKSETGLAYIRRAATKAAAKFVGWLGRHFRLKASNVRHHARMTSMISGPRRSRS